jgi:2-oxoglutarate ferredoxin oxidoreductase subunit delta
MSRIEIAAELCKACELCISVCPKDCITRSDTLNRYGVYPMQMRDDAECTACTLCATMCPDTAIEVFRTIVEKPVVAKPVAETPVAATPQAPAGIAGMTAGPVENGPAAGGNGDTHASAVQPSAAAATPQSEEAAR